MLAKNELEFIEFFKDIEDPRQDEKVMYPIHEIVFLVLVGVLCCAESWEEILDFGIIRLHSLRQYFSYANGLPSISTLLRVMGLISQKLMAHWLKNNAAKIVKDLREELVVLDGKSLKGKRKFSSAKNNTHILNVFASGLGIVLAQKAIEEKTNEITAIHEILDDLNFAGTTVSIDAMGCQTAIVAKIVEQGGDYVLSLKGNQCGLLSDVESMFAAKSYKPTSHSTVDKGHGRIEQRTCFSLGNISWLQERHPAWQKLNSIAKITSTRIIKGQETTEDRYYISSLAADAENLLKCVRQHWSIENNLHWMLDVQFKEDASLIRNGYAAENMSAVRKMALNILKEYKARHNVNRSIPGLRKKMGFDEQFMVEVIDSWIYNCS